MGIGSTLKSAMLFVLFAASLAGAHPQTSLDATIPQPNPAGLEGGFYLWSYQGLTSLWQETNGKPTDGMYADSAGSAVLGLQLHNVCYDTFTAADVDCLNRHHGNQLFTYLPWGYFESTPSGPVFVDGNQEDCEAREGTFVAKDTILYGQYDLALEHLGTFATQCFPAGYGR